MIYDIHESNIVKPWQNILPTLQHPPTITRVSRPWQSWAEPCEVNQLLFHWSWWLAPGAGLCNMRRETQMGLSLEFIGQGECAIGIAVE